MKKLVIPVNLDLNDLEKGACLEVLYPNAYICSILEFFESDSKDTIDDKDAWLKAIRPFYRVYDHALINEQKLIVINFPSIGVFDFNDIVRNGRQKGYEVCIVNITSDQKVFKQYPACEDSVVVEPSKTIDEMNESIANNEMMSLFQINQNEKERMINASPRFDDLVNEERVYKENMQFLQKQHNDKVMEQIENSVRKNTHFWISENSGVWDLYKPE